MGFRGLVGDHVHDRLVTRKKPKENTHDNN